LAEKRQTLGDGHRELAFLKTDLPQSGITFPNTQAREDDDIIRARWHTAFLIAALVPSYFISWWIIVVACVFSEVCYLVQIWIHDAEEHETQKAALKLLLAYEPFVNEEEWIAHQSLLEQFHLPLYEEVHYKLPTRWARFLSAVGPPIGFSVLSCVVAVMDVATGKKVRLTFAPGADVLPVFSPDGKKLMWTSTRDGRQPAQLYIADFAVPTD
jgi:hypothetical protein